MVFHGDYDIDDTSDSEDRVGDGDDDDARATCFRKVLVLFAGVRYSLRHKIR